MIKDNEQNRFSEFELYNIALSKRFFREVWNERRTQTLLEIFSPDIVFHHEHEKIIGIKRWKEKFYDVLIGAVPDVSVELEDIISKGNLIVTRWTAQGVHKGELFGVSPSNERIKVNGMDWARVVDGKVVEIWSNWSLSYLLRQVQLELKALRGILPLCSFCKKIRDDKGYWEQVDVYIHKYSEADISHSICPECMKTHYPDEYASLISNND